MIIAPDDLIDLTLDRLVQHFAAIKVTTYPDGVATPTSFNADKHFWDQITVPPFPKWKVKYAGDNEEDPPGSDWFVDNETFIARLIVLTFAGYHFQYEDLMNKTIWAVKNHFRKYPHLNDLSDANTGAFTWLAPGRPVRVPRVTEPIAAAPAQGAENLLFVDFYLTVKYRTFQSRSS